MASTKHTIIEIINEISNTLKGAINLVDVYEEISSYSIKLYIYIL